jgi:5-methylcytosine-specific restriction enzyme A
VATFLFAMNPKLWQWTELAADRRKLAKKGFLDIEWSSGRARQIEPGSRAFLVRLGVPPKGLFASGVTLDWPTEGPHWRPEKIAAGIPALHVKLRLEMLFPLPIVTFDDFAEPPFKRFRWGVRQSGTRVPSTIADAVEELWEARVAAQAVTAGRAGSPRRARRG